MKHKYLLVAISLMVVVSILMAACVPATAPAPVEEAAPAEEAAPEEEAVPEEAPSPASSKAETVTFASWAEEEFEQQAIEEMLRAFEVETGVTVEYIIVTSGGTISGGAP